METNRKIIWRLDSMFSGSSHILSLIERTKRRKKIQKVVEDKLFHILVLWQKWMFSSYFEKKNLQFEFWLFLRRTFHAMV